MHLCAAKCKPRGECRQKGVGNPCFIQGNTAQITAEALSVASLADFPATVTKMLANTQSIRCAFCLTCQKICRRDSSLRIVRCCPKAFLRGSSTGKSRWFPYSIKNALRFGAQAFVLNSAAGALGGKATKQRFMWRFISSRPLRAAKTRSICPWFSRV